MKLLMYDHLPRWYGLSWSNKELAVTVRVHRELLSQLKPINPEAPIVKELSQGFGFTTFVGDFPNYLVFFGFDGALVRQPRGPGDDEYIIFRGNLPKVRCQTTKRCRECRGSKKNQFIPDKSCYNCDGTGKEYEYRWRRAEALSASLGLLLALMAYPSDDFATTAKQQQLLLVRTGSGKGYAFINGMYSIPLADWLRRQEVGKPLAEMIGAMRRVYAHMMGESRADPFHFRASVDYPSGWLNMSVPEGGISPSHGDSPEIGLGYEFSTHHVDHVGQRLALFAGLAALHDQVDHELYGT